MIKKVPHDSFGKVTPEWDQSKTGRGRDGGRIEWKSSEINFFV